MDTEQWTKLGLPGVREALGMLARPDATADLSVGPGEWACMLFDDTALGALLESGQGAEVLGQRPVWTPCRSWTVCSPG